MAEYLIDVCDPRAEESQLLLELIVEAVRYGTADSLKYLLDRYAVGLELQKARLGRPGGVISCLNALRIIFRK